MSDMAHAYFSSLFRESLTAISAIPWQGRAYAIAEVDGALRATASATTSGLSLEHPGEISTGLIDDSRREGVTAGMNTVGLLLDRLSILAIKIARLRREPGSIGEAERVRTGAAENVIDALAVVRPGDPSLATKVTTHAVNAVGSSFTEIYRTLLVSNVLLWEAQEVLYLSDLDTAPCKELRDYIKLFSRENLRRNASISALEDAFWSAADRAS